MKLTLFQSQDPPIMIVFLYILAATSILPPAPTEAAPVGTGFTYQGSLAQGGTPANGIFDFELKLFDLDAAGNQVGSTLQIGNVTVTAGVFTTYVDFGAGAFGGGARWVEIGVRPGVSTGPYTILSPRQLISPAPIAMSLPNVFTNEGLNFVGIGRDFRISGNEVFGIRYTGGANQYGGMYVETSNSTGWPFYGYATNGSFRAWTYYNGESGDWYLYNAGIRLKVPNEGGLRIGPSADYSLVIENTTGSDGIRILDTGDDAIQIGSNPDIPNYGVYIPSPGVSTYGLWSNTSNAAGEWALYTVDKIQAGNVKATSFSTIGQVTGSAKLNPGDVVGASGIAKGIPGGLDRIPLVHAAVNEKGDGIIGVVDSRMAFKPAPGKEGDDALVLHSADGSASPGDYVSLVVSGVAEVRVDPEVTIKAGERLTASEMAGRARGLKTQKLNGMLVTEGAPVIGTALSAPVPGKDTIPVFVSLR